MGFFKRRNGAFQQGNAGAQTHQHQGTSPQDHPITWGGHSSALERDMESARNGEFGVKKMIQAHLVTKLENSRLGRWANTPTEYPKHPGFDHGGDQGNSSGNHDLW